MQTRLRAVALLAAAIVVTVVVVVLVRARDGSPSKGSSSSFICADVGLVRPSASTPREALDAFIVQRGGALSDWKRIGHSTTRPTGASVVDDYTFAPRNGTALSGFSRVSVRARAGVSTLTGGCVG